MLMSNPAAAHRAAVATPNRSTLCSTPLTSQERERINAGAWFASLSPALRHDIIRCASVQRYQCGDTIAAQADAGAYWLACAKGTNEDIGKKMLAESGLPIISADTMADAAEKVVAAVKAAV